MSDSIKSIAMYLPQFHQVPENDKWWGEGYTEWTAVKSATPLFKGHQQPKIPYGSDYYNLLYKKTLMRQAELAKKYGISGFCFYHYWFEKNRKMLEKPAENLLKWKDIDLPFCFAWDPSQWARTWTRLGNSWADKFETNKKKITNDDTGILIKQSFGDETYWRAHFDYLLDFFKDDRYIKFNNKPMFIFYNSQSISCLDRMIYYWRKWARDAGLEGLHVVAFHVPSDAADAVILPMAFAQSTLGYDMNIEHTIEGTTLRGYDYDVVWKDYLSYMPSQTQPTYWLCTVDFDDTPRRGLNGRVYMGASPSKFKKYYSLLLEKSKKTNNPFIFIDAWNEWGEGKYLEPDTKNGFEYLNAVKEVMRGIYTNSEDTDLIKDTWTKQARILEKQLLTKMKNSQLSDIWLEIERKKVNIAEALCTMGYKHVAIYGYGKYGKMFYDEIACLGSKVHVDYFIDKHSDGLKKHLDTKIYSPCESLPACDVIIVSVVSQFNDIMLDLKKHTEIPIISLYEVLYEIEKA